MFLRSLQNINQSYIKCTENASLTHDNDDDSNNDDVVIVVINDNSNDGFKNEEKV